MSDGYNVFELIAQVRAFGKECVTHGDMTPAAQIMLNRILDEFRGGVGQRPRVASTYDDALVGLAWRCPCGAFGSGESTSGIAAREAHRCAHVSGGSGQ